MKLLRNLSLTFGAMLLLGLTHLAHAQAAPMASGQSVYLPIYSHVYHGNLDRKGNPDKVLLSAMVSIRNTDPKQAIRVTSARYYNTDGRLVKEFVTQPKSVAAFGTLELFVERHDESGGSGANFAITWESDVPVNLPLIEAVHAGFEGARSVLFTTSARAIRPAD